MQPITPSDTEDEWSAEMMAAKERLLAIGAEQDEAVPRAFWHNNHCFYIKDDGEIDEL
jgi:hypothetical protein